MTLRPPETSNKALISSTSGFVGEYEAEGILLTHAWSLTGASANAQRLDGPTSWSAFVVAFETSPFPREVGSALPNHSWIPEQLTWYLSVLFGKRFDNHGLFETIGMFNLPNLERVSAFCRNTLPHNSRKVRADYPTALNLAEVARIAPMISDAGLDAQVMRIWHTAAKFYTQALQTLEGDAEVAYLHLVTAIEVLTSLSKVETAELYDPTTLRHLAAIEATCPMAPRWRITSEIACWP